MKITNLTESSTTAGAVAPVSVPFKSVQKREAATVKGKGSLLKGIKTSEKYANSVSEGKEEEKKSGLQQSLDKKTKERNKQDSNRPPKVKVKESTGTGPNTDSILEYLTKAYRAIVNSGAYSDRGNQVVKTVYGVLREPLMQGDMTKFSTRYDYASAKYPDEFDELINRMYAEAGLGDNGTYDQFIAKVSEGLSEAKEKTTRVDMMGKTCDKCKKDKFKERSQHDDMQGQVTCSCGNRVTRHQDKKAQQRANDDEWSKIENHWKSIHGKDVQMPSGAAGEQRMRQRAVQDRVVKAESVEIQENDLVLAPGKGRQHKPGLLNKPEVTTNPTDVVKLDVPLLIRLLEFSKEDAQTDMDLHELAEKLVACGARGRTLTMKDYDRLIPEVKPQQAEPEVAESTSQDDGIYMGAKVYHTEHQSGEPFKVVKIIDDQRVGVIDEYGNKQVMIINQLVPAQQEIDEATDEDRPWVTYSNAQNVHRFNTYEQAVAAQKKFGPNYKIASADWFDKEFSGDEVTEASKGRFVRGPDDSGNIVDYDRQGNPKPVKPAKVPTVRGPRKDVNGMTRADYDTVWRKIEDVVGQIFPDGDPIDWMAPWLKRNGVEGFKIGDVLDKACKLNGYSDMYEYYDSMKTGDYGYDEQVNEVSADTLASYQQKANFDARGAHSRLNSFEPGVRTTPGDASHEADKRLLRKRTSGINAAQKRISGNKGDR